MNIKTILLLVVISMAAFIIFGFVSESRALDQSQPQEAPVPALVEPIDVEDIYLRLKVDWDGKADITRFARVACHNFSGEKAVECLKEQKYFDKKQTSEKALIKFVEFNQEHEVY